MEGAGEGGSSVGKTGDVGCLEAVGNRIYRGVGVWGGAMWVWGRGSLISACEGG